MPVDSPTLEPWENILYRAGYAQALADAGRVVIAQAKTYIAQGEPGETAADVLLNVGTRIVKLECALQLSGETRH